MAYVEEIPDTRYDDIDLESILARVERRGPLLFTRKRCLYRAPEFVKRLSGETTVEEGSTVRFECRIVGIPTPSVKWTKDDEELPNDDRIKVEASENGEHAITIEKIKKKDEAAYRIKAENGEGSSSSTIYVAVKVKSKKAKRANRIMHHPSGFTPITEKIKEEEQEEEVTKTQPESPLTPLYSGTTRKNRTWPDFLGSWAFVNGIGKNDFDDLSEADDDEDVFSTGESSESDSFSINGSDVLPRSENNGFSDSDSENEIKRLLHGNLVFENQKLAQFSLSNTEDICNKEFGISSANSSYDSTHGDYGNYTEGDFPTDGSVANHKSFSTTNSTPPMISLVSPSHGMVNKDCSSVDLILDISSKEVTEEFCSLSRTSSHDRYLGGEDCTIDKIQDSSPYRPMDFPWLDAVCLASSITFIALNTSMAPSSFVISIVLQLLLYCIMRFLLKQQSK